MQVMEWEGCQNCAAQIPLELLRGAMELLPQNKNPQSTPCAIEAGIITGAQKRATLL